MPIKLLEPKVIAQIAAGEVVERPASVIKELVENSLDAGATQITVEIKDGGIDMMRVTDNGSGIPAAEVDLAFERHATSKISSLNDLNRIGTLGFRGEALASIAAVAEVELVTRATGETAGTCISLADGAVTGKTSRGRPQGTTITVTHLFRKVPARLKFLKSQPTENSHIADVISQYSLAYPEVRFELSLEGKRILNTPGSGRLVDSLTGVYGIEVSADMLEISGSESKWEDGTVNTITVSGMVGKPSVNRTGKGYLSFFVNRRWVNSRVLAYAVEEAYHGLLMQGRHPVAVVNIKVNPGEVDANIHPTKTEVKFANEKAVFGAVQKAVRRTLIQEAPVPKIEESLPHYTAAPGTQAFPAFTRTAAAASVNPMPEVQMKMGSLPILRVLGQFASNYIVAEGDDGIYIIDQHAAHERVRFEQIREQRDGNAVEVQGLLEPAAFEVSPGQAQVMSRKYVELTGFGFSLEPFGERTYLVRTVPAVLYDRNWQAVLREILDHLTGGDRTTWEENITATIACHSAIRAGQVLTENEMRELIRQLESTLMPRTCPHGRPTMIHLTTGQLEKEFGRT